MGPDIVTQHHHHFLCPLVFVPLLGFLMNCVSHCLSAHSPTLVTCKVVSTSQFVLLKKTGLLHSLGSYKKGGNSILTSVVSIWCVLNCDYATVLISQPVLQASSNNF
jgi:hypothetical protein